jgi:N-acetylmuramoyl-L-alanine amidase
MDSLLTSKVTLDAGHGGHDFGAVYNGHVEKI